MSHQRLQQVNEDGLELARKYPPRTLALVSFIALLVVGIATAAVVKADPAADDQKFLRALHNAGMVLVPNGETIVIENAHYICSAAWRGESTDDLAAEVDAAEPYANLAQAQTFVAISLMVYCPQIGARS